MGCRPPRGQRTRPTPVRLKRRTPVLGGVIRFCVFPKWTCETKFHGSGAWSAPYGHTSRGHKGPPAVLKEQRAGGQVSLLLHAGRPHKRFCLGRGIHTLWTPESALRAHSTRTLPGTRAPPRAQRAPRTDDTAPAQLERAPVPPLWWLWARPWAPKDATLGPHPHVSPGLPARTQELTLWDSSPLRAGRR